MTERTIRLEGRRAERVLEADVVVVGGGSAGLAAAVSSAQCGARTVLLERYGFFGGNATAAWVGTVCGLYYRAGETNEVLCRGFASRWAEELQASGGAFGPIPYKETAVLLYVPWAYKRQADRWVAAEPGLTPLLHAPVTEAVVTGRMIDAVIIGSKRGPLAVTGKVFIDSSGDADVAFHAGVRTATGGAGQRQFPSMQFLMENVDVQAAYAAGLDRLNELLATEGQKPEWNLSRTGGAVLPTFRPGEAVGAMTRIGVGPDRHAPDMTDPFEATEAEMTGRAEAEKAARFLAAHMPGFGEAFLADTPTQLGVRETRRAAGEYELNGDDVLGAGRFDDAVAVGAWPQEFHVAGKETQWVWLEQGAYYQVPYRSLVASGIDNLLLAGRCICATHEALASTRVIAPSMAQGEAAGVAAALAAGKGVPAAAVDVGEVQRVLRERGAFIG
jgi:FAD-dependent oxidoreductase family protein